MTGQDAGTGLGVAVLSAVAAAGSLTDAAEVVDGFPPPPSPPPSSRSSSVSSPTCGCPPPGWTAPSDAHASMDARRVPSQAGPGDGSPARTPVSIGYRRPDTGRSGNRSAASRSAVPLGPARSRRSTRSNRWDPTATVTTLLMVVKLGSRPAHSMQSSRWCRRHRASFRPPIAQRDAAPRIRLAYVERRCRCVARFCSPSRAGSAPPSASCAGQGDTQRSRTDTHGPGRQTAPRPLLTLVGRACCAG